MISGLWNKAINILKKGGVVVAPTDTIYGVVCSAFSKDAVLKIYKIRGRNKDKPCIILISSFSDLDKFEIKISDEETKILENIWPGKVSVVLPCEGNKFKYLHRGTKTLALRMVGPKNKNIFNLIKKAGPLVAPSANPQGLAYAMTIKEAKNYFNKKVDLYIDVGKKVSLPSTLIELKAGKFKILRFGSVKIKTK